MGIVVDLAVWANNHGNREECCVDAQNIWNRR